MQHYQFCDACDLHGLPLQLLKKEGWVAVDTHFHTQYSLDAISKIPAVLKRCRSTGVGVAITDHNAVAGVPAIWKKKGDAFVVPGMELISHEGIHLVLLFYTPGEAVDFYKREIVKLKRKDDWFLPPSFVDLVHIAARYDCVRIAPHPFGPGAIGIEKYASKKYSINKHALTHIHGIEVINGCCLRKMNEHGLRWAATLDKGITGGSDGHSTIELGTVLTMAKADDVEGFLDAIKRKKTFVLGQEEDLYHDMMHTMQKFVTEQKKEKLSKSLHMLKERFGTEYDYLKDRVTHSSFWKHYHAHHTHPERK